ncbi:glycosyltransferase family 4 protein [Sediminibacterium roseum]|uniref:Glycosyltransferase family 4 protein n=1 Tax=Sediminibacterium roseum TaxID=1978412 RepID=A0ABW9ZQ69_9BACT|nr:glycosyltransferase family 1 protein [Sediminibacterium roseum]NCI48409.1 glycosyltransferase family 4 protein [Sediminibacterium roseum]
MRIAINAIFLQKDQLEGYGHYANEVFSRMVKQHPEHEFVFLFDREYDPKYIYAGNVKPMLVPPAARHPLAFFTWYNLKAPAALRSEKIDVWVQPYGFCSLTTKIPQVLVMHDLSFVHFPKFIPWYHRMYYRAFTKKFLAKAKRIVTVSEFTKNDIIQQYHTSPGKINVVHGAARENFKPVSWFEREEMKEGFAGGTEYFLFTGGIHPRKNLMNLLKAFSLFKKWQHSNMKLLVAGRLAWDYEFFLEKLRTYKYREDVVLLGYQPEEELARITAGAYALVYPSYFEGFGLPIVEAMQAEVPVITSNTSSMPEIGADAALYADPSKPDEIAKHMQHVYRDEILRTSLIEKGKIRAAEFSWDKAAEELWQNVLAAAG